jgi:iron complex outermembrane receptor protein
LRFGFDDWRFPVDGNVGVRYVKTDMKAHGYTVFNPTGIPNDPSTVTGGPAIPIIAAVLGRRGLRQQLSQRAAKPEPAHEGDRQAAVPLRRRDGHVASGLHAAAGLYDAVGNVRFDPDRQRRTTVNNVSLTGQSDGNPNLRPTKSSQVDLTMNGTSRRPVR